MTSFYISYSQCTTPCDNYILVISNTILVSFPFPSDPSFSHQTILSFFPSLYAPLPFATNIHRHRSSLSFAGIPQSPLATVPFLRFTLFLILSSLTLFVGVSLDLYSPYNPFYPQTSGEIWDEEQFHSAPTSVAPSSSSLLCSGAQPRYQNLDPSLQGQKVIFSFKSKFSSSDPLHFQRKCGSTFLCRAEWHVA